MNYLAIASGAAVLMVFVSTFLVTYIDSIGSNHSSFGLSFFIASIAACVAIIVIAVWAIPMYFLLNRFKKFNAVWYLLCAIIPAFVFVYGFKPFGNDTSLELLVQALLCALFGCLSALLFWYIAVYRQRILKD